MAPLHVANGHCTTRLIEAAGLSGRTQIWADVLHDGPVPDVPDDELVRVRARVIASGLDVTPEAVEADLRHWRAVVDDHAAYDELVLWFEHDLFDQLNLIQLLSRVGAGSRHHSENAMQAQPMAPIGPAVVVATSSSNAMVRSALR